MVTVTQWALHANWQKPKPERKQAREETLPHYGPLRILIITEQNSKGLDVLLQNINWRLVLVVLLLRY